LTNMDKKKDDQAPAATDVEKKKEEAP